MHRRTWLKLGVVSAAVLALLGGTAALIQPGLERGTLTATGRDVFTAVSQAVLDKTLPDEAVARQAALVALLGRINVLINALPPHAQTEVSQLLSILGSSAGRLGLAGVGKPWLEASTTEVQAALQNMRLSSLAVRQQAYAALHDITAGAYFSDSSTWGLLGYPGPLAV